MRDRVVHGPPVGHVERDRQRVLLAVLLSKVGHAVGVAGSGCDLVAALERRLGPVVRASSP